MAQAPEAPPPKDSIIFRGTSVATYKPREDNIPPSDFKSVCLDGNNSIYYVYPDVNQSGHATPASLHVIETAEEQDLHVKPPRSCKGFSKRGIILFETFNYGGESQNFLGSGEITSAFPPGQREGVTSFRVIEGTWELLNKDGAQLLVQGKTQFEPGFCSDMPQNSDRLHSIKRVR